MSSKVKKDKDLNTVRMAARGNGHRARADFRTQWTGRARIAEVLEIARYVAVQMCERFGFSSLNFSQVDENGGNAVVFYDSRSDRHSETADLTELFKPDTLAQLRSGQSVVLSKLDAAAPADAIYASGAGAAIHVPYVSGGRWKFMMSASSALPLTLHPDDLQILREVTERVYLRLERALADEALIDFEEKTRLALDGAGVYSWEIWLPDGKLQVSGNAGAVLGFNWPHDVTEAMSYYHPDDVPAATKAFERAVASDGTIDFEARVINPDTGETIWQKATGKVMLDEDGNPVRALGVAHNITEQKRREEDQAFLADVADRLNRVTSPHEVMVAAGEMIGKYLSADFSHFVEIDEAAGEARVLYRWNAHGVPIASSVIALSDAVGEEFYPAAQAGSTIVVRDSTSDKKANAEQTVAANIRSFISVPLHKDGSWKFALAVCDSKPRDWRDHEISLFREFADRVFPRIERARAEEALRESESRYRSLFNSIDEGFCVLELVYDKKGVATDYRFLQVNPAFEKHTGLNDAVGKLSSEVVAESDPYWLNVYAEVATSGKSVRIQNRSQGLGRWFDAFISRVDNDVSKKVAVVFTDITERKRSELALRESEERFGKAFNASPLSITITSLKTGKLVEVNDTFVRLTGFSRDEAIGRSTADLGLWREPAERDAELATLLKDGNLRNVEYTFKLRDGSEIIGLLSAELIDLGGDQCALTVIEDITDRKKAEEALRKSEMETRRTSLEFQTMYESSPVAMCRLDRDLKFVRVNDRYAEINSISAAEHIGQTLFQVDPEFSSDFGPSLYSVMKSGKPVFGIDIPGKVASAEGTTRWWSHWWFPQRNLVGEITGVNIVAVEITDRKEAERKLQRSQERYYLAQEAGNVGIWDWDVATNTTYWSGAMWKFYGERRRNVNPDENFWISHIHPEDADRVRLNINQVVESGEQFRDEFRVLRKDRSVRWLEAKGDVLRDESGKAVRMYGVNLDITERKEAEHRLRLSEYQLRVITNAVPALISYVDKTERYRFVNQQFTEWFGESTEDLIGKKVKDVVGRSAYKTLKPHIQTAMSGRECTFEAVLSYPKIKNRHVHVSYVPDIGVDGSVYGYYGLTSDLTELRRSEDLLRSTEERLSIIMESFTDHAIFSLDIDGRIDTWNKGAEFIFGFSQEEAVGQSSSIIFTPEDIAQGLPTSELLVAREKGRASDERWHVRKDGTRFYASGATMALYTGKILTGYSKIARDLTERKRHAEELQRAHDELELRVIERTKELAEANSTLIVEMEEREVAERQRIDLLRRLVSGQEFERRRIARDLHDQLGQRLTALRLKIASLKDAAVGNPDFASRVQRLQEIAERLDSEVSFLAWELRPSALDDLGLVQAIGAFVNEWSRHYETPADFYATKFSDDRLDREVETHIYRITQEALNNITKHAKANHVSVLLERHDENVVLVIEDDGVGFEVSEVAVPEESGKGLGLVGMRERASLIGGHVEIESAVGEGTTIFVRIPFSSD